MSVPKMFYVANCNDCPFQNTDREMCNASDEDIPVWSQDSLERIPLLCPLHGVGVHVVIASWAKR